MHRSGENEYLINDSPVRLKDITELLGNVGLGASSHHIISPGRSGQVLNASPKDRKEMIEEALGLKIYRIKSGRRETAGKNGGKHKTGGKFEKRNSAPTTQVLEKRGGKIEEAEKFKTELKNIYAEFIPREKDYLKEESDKISAEKNKIVEDIKMAEKSRAIFTGPPRPGEAGDSPAEAVKKSIKDIEVQLAKEESELGKLRLNRNSMEREFGKLEGIIEYRQSLSLGFSKSEEELPPVPRQEVLAIMKAVQDSAILGAVIPISPKREKFLKI